MKKHIRYIFQLLIIVVLVQSAGYAQKDNVKRHKIALFVPLYLDSAFAAGTNEYRYGKQFPKYISPGLEFYEGAQLAMDSLEKEGIALEVNIYDTRSGKSIPQVVSEQRFNGTSLIIAHVSSYNEVGLFSRIAKEYNIPFINANLPNDGGVTKNPFLVILNSTLRTHCQAIYRFLQRNHATSRLVVFQKKGNQENILKSYFTDIEKTTASVPLKLKFVTLENNFTSQQLIPYLDSNEVTMCVGASLDDNFAKNLSQQLAAVNSQYPSQVIGMPTWDAIPFERKEYEGLEIFYTTPFYNDKSDKVSSLINTHFKTVLFQRPSDMVFRGYECLYRFGKLLNEQGSNISTAIGEKKYKVFTDFDIQPVFLNSASQGIDYFENRKLYFIKKLNGQIKGVY